MTLWKLLKRSSTNSADTPSTEDGDKPMVHQIKLLTVGDSGVGKSSVILRYTEDTFTPNFLSTIGIDYKLKSLSLDDDTRCKLQIWDTAGQERFRNITNAYYRGAQAIILVYDITDEQSFLNVRYWLRQIETHSTANPLTVLLGNKSDLSSQRQVTLERGQQLAKDYDIAFYETSAKTNTNIDEAFSHLIHQVIELQKSKCLLQRDSADHDSNDKNDHVKLHEMSETLSKLKHKMNCSGCNQT